MPKYRQLHTKIVDSYDFNEMPDDFTRVFWLLLTVTSDSEGRSIDSPAWIRSKMFPLREDVTSDQINNALAWLAGRGMIVRYKANGRSYFHIPTWKKYQSGTEKEGASSLPSPDDAQTEQQAPANAQQINSGVTPEPLRSNSVSIQYNAVAVQDEPPLLLERPNAYQVYESEIGVITPMIAASIDDACKTSPPGWVEDAIREASKNNKRNWAYVTAILKRWNVEGKSTSKAAPINGGKRRPTWAELEGRA